MPECRLYTIQGKKQFHLGGTALLSTKTSFLFSSRTTNFTSYLSSVTQAINSANSKMMNVPCKCDSEHHQSTQMQQKCFLNLLQALLNNSHLYHQAKADFKNRGIEGRCQIKVLFIMYWFYLWQCTRNIYLLMLAASCKKRLLLLLFLFCFFGGVW